MKLVSVELFSERGLLVFGGTVSMKPVSVVLELFFGGGKGFGVVVVGGFGFGEIVIDFAKSPLSLFSAF